MAEIEDGFLPSVKAVCHALSILFGRSEQWMFSRLRRKVLMVFSSFPNGSLQLWNLTVAELPLGLQLTKPLLQLSMSSGPAVG